MITIPGYYLKEIIHERNNTTVYRGKREQDGKLVIIKIFKPENLEQSGIFKFTQEYEIAKELSLEGVVKPIALEYYNNRYILISEDFGGVSLKEILKKEKLDLKIFLTHAISLAETLGQIHKAKIIHKDIKPSNIIIDSENYKAKITDFGISTKLNSERARYSPTNILEGTLSYISPEQTGRMNRSVDYRTDLYSLGVTFYEMLTGKLPYESDDPLELVHSHIAKQPMTPHDFNYVIPKIVSNIVMKLMEKTAEKRYQSAFGLKADLERYYNYFIDEKLDDIFELGKEDFSGRFQISQKLYGREKEIEILMNAFEQVSSRDSVETLCTTSLLLVSGHPGVGKSALVHEVHKPITEKKGYFTSGKFDQYQRNVPYYAIKQAFNELCNHWVTETEEVLVEWKRKILEAVENSGQVLIEVIPDLELVIGKQPEVPVLGPQESQNRFNLLFQNFINAIAKKDHPLVIFIDDLQWADSGSLALFKTLLSDADSETEVSLLLIGAYRDNEVNATHPFILTLEEIKKKEVLTYSIELTPLKKIDVQNLIKDALSCEPEESDSLADLTYQKTNGNAFFVNEFLKNLYEEDLLAFDFNLKKWTWDIKKIQSKNVTSNVVELMSQKIDKLKEETQEVLQLTSCIGNKFGLKNLSIIYEKSVQSTLADLWEAVEEGLILPLDNNYKLINSVEDSMHPLQIDSEFQFLHDRVQQAAYGLIEESHRQEVHLKIGRLLLSKTLESEWEDRIFDIVSQYNQGKELIVEENEKLQLAELNLQVARKAKLSSAYGPALEYISTGISLLPEDSWEKNYPLTYNCYLEKGEIEYLNAHWDEALAVFDKTLEYVHTTIERCKINEYKIALYRIKNDLLSGLDVAIQTLELLGIKLKSFPEQPELASELDHLKELLIDKDLKSLENLPEMQDPEKLAAMVILRECVNSAYALGSLLLFIAGIKMVSLSIQYGNSPHTSVGYSFYAALTLAVLQRDYESAYKFGKLGLKLNEKYQVKPYDALIANLWGSFVSHYTEPIKNATDVLLRGYLSGVETGSLQGAAYCAANCLFLHFWGASTLAETMNLIDMILPGLKKIDKVMLQYYYSIKASIYNLITTSEDWSVLSESVWPDATAIINASVQNNDHLSLAIFAVCKLSLASWYGDPKKAIEFANEAEKSIAGATGIFPYPIFHIHQCLALSLSYESVNEEQKIEYLEKIKSNLASIEIWAKHAPSTYLHFSLLVNAELARITGDDLRAQSLYDEAIESARENKFLHALAHANELAARYWLAKKKPGFAGIYIIAAHSAYFQWGAIVKAKQLEERHPEFFVRTISPATIGGKNTLSYGSTTGAQLDMSTALKASQAISSEIRLENLLKQIIKILIENAGAEKGALILRDEKTGKFLLQAESSVFDREPVALQAIPMNKTIDKLPVNVIQYVIRSKTNVILGDASRDERFAKDRYILANQTKSLLCFPLIHQGQLIGILYLQNNLATDVFTPDRIHILNLISSQAGVSINNALLYTNLEDKVKERTMELEKTLNKVNGLKTQQDADYFLTAMLIQPLSANQTEGSKISIDFFLKQKKEFEFKKCQEEIGGDICIANVIFLKNKKMTVFINADAMGKSIQGAGGAIVLGSVFKSIIERTIINSTIQDQYPEKWLRDSFLELHKVFESFDGSMLVSVVMGLVEEDTGFMYFINAEHPQSALYRDCKASFIGNSQKLAKLGSQFMEEAAIEIQTFQILSGDIIIHGSDGRDDLILGYKEDVPIINENLDLFLEVVEKGKGEPKQIMESIQQKGEIKDDLSLLRISLSDNYSLPILQKINLASLVSNYKSFTKQERLTELNMQLETYNQAEKKNIYLLKILTKEYIKLKEYNFSSVCSEKYLDSVPSDIEMIYISSYCHKKSKQFEKAIQLGERVRLRNPKYVKNLINLGDAYYLSEKKARAIAIFREIALLYPSNRKVINFLANNESLTV